MPKGVCISHATSGNVSKGNAFSMSWKAKLSILFGMTSLLPTPKPRNELVTRPRSQKRFYVELLRLRRMKAISFLTVSVGPERLRLWRKRLDDAGSFPT